MARPALSAVTRTTSPGRIWSGLIVSLRPVPTSRAVIVVSDVSVNVRMTPFPLREPAARQRAGRDHRRPMALLVPVAVRVRAPERVGLWSLR